MAGHVANPDAKALPRPNGGSGMPTADALNLLPKAALAGLACEAAAVGDVEGARVLINAGVSMDVGTPYDQRTPLHLAAAAGNLRMVQFLVEECHATLRRDRFGLLPINDAVQSGHAEVRRYLQSKKLEWAKEKVEQRRVGRVRSDSLESFTDFMFKHESNEEIMGTVFELVVKEGIFSYTTVFAEVQHFFRGLGLHPMYFEHFTPLQIAKHIHCLIAAKRVAQATDDRGRMDFVLTTEHHGFFLTTIDCPTPTEAQKRTEAKVTKHLDDTWLSGKSHQHVSVTFMASEGAIFKGGRERLGIFTAERGTFDVTRVSEDETSLEVLASARFLKEKTRPAKEQYQIIMEDVVASRRAVVRVVPGSVYPGPYPGGHVLLFGTPETVGRTYFVEVCQAMRFLALSPRRFYLESFANGVITYSIFFPSGKEDEVQRLGRTIMYSTHLQTRGMIYSSVMEAQISHEVGLYLSAAVKFVYAFFPKEQYAPEYTSVHKVLEKDPSSQRMLEALYKLCMRDLLSTERIFDLLHRHLDLAVLFFEDFKGIAMGTAAPGFNAQLGAAIDKSCLDQQDRQILKMFLTFNESILLTNFFKAETPGAFAFRLNPAVVLKGRPQSLYPDVPFGIYLVSGRNFLGFHVRFRDVARGGVRLVLSRDQTAHERNLATLFDECYNLAFTQHMKNKDIPEGGAKGVILPDPAFVGGGGGGGGGGAKGGKAPLGNSAQSPVSQRSCFTRYLNALLDCMLPEQCGIYHGHVGGRKEILYFGPDENSANFMDLGAELGKIRGYPYWKALTTGKSVKLGGVPHDTYGMTTASVHTYVTELLRELGEDEASISKFQTGGPDGDLGSNEIMVSRDRTVAIVDGSGVLYDPAGLHREELKRLAKRRAAVKDFTRSFLGPDGFLVRVEETNVVLPDGSTWRTGAELRDSFHLTKYAAADLFVPCGGRPNSITAENVKHLFDASGKPKFRMIVEGANLFLSDGACAVLETAGVHVFKDASTNKGGVCSSSLEVFSALALPEQEHAKLMTYDPETAAAEPPEFYAAYVQQILDIIVENAQQEFKAIWACNQRDGIPKVEATRKLSIKINQVADSIQEQLKSGMTEQEKQQLLRSVLLKAAPPLMIQHLGLDSILARVPENYLGSIVAAWVASRFVYQYGINASEVSFFFFMRSLIMCGDYEAATSLKRPAEDEEAPRSAVGQQRDAVRPRLA